MIVHVILFSPRPDLDGARRLQILESFRAAAERAATVRAVRIGRRVRHGLPGYDSAMGEDFEFFAAREFEDVEGLKTYLQDPAHEAAGRHFGSSAAAALAYDYAVVSPSELAALVSGEKNA